MTRPISWSVWTYPLGMWGRTSLSMYPKVLLGPCLVLYSSSSLGMVRNFLMLTPFSKRSFTKSILSCSNACIIASLSAPSGHSWPYINISDLAISTRFHVRAKLSCSEGVRCWARNSAVKMVWSSSCVIGSARSDILNTVI